MKIEVFAILESVLRTGTIAAASRESNLTASAVSIQMKNLESYVGEPLFDRSGLQVKPLPLALKISEIMKRAAAEMAQLRQPTEIAIKGTARIGMIESMQPLLLPEMFKILGASYAELHVNIRRGKSGELTDAVKSGELDAAVVGQPETGGTSRLHWHPLFRRELVLIAPPEETDHRLPSVFARHAWIRYDRGTIAGRLATRYVNARVRATIAGQELDSVRAIAAMVSAGLGVSVVQLAEPGLALAFPMQVFSLRQAPVLTISMVSRKVDREKRILVAVQDVLERAARVAKVVR
jgi:DNA-binding transcriptional LysR family regulator